ncbi:ATP-binding SpoIIE family protein phosphatase [Streptacidiphilus fuscans]|uniref:protein-serine/threonine phosphatase n=1 Tax=Streptacidiphilus fuscans TaxID=2789292 RepID=A0A931FER6_9ACTN|nr:SpoIIE family protein phosphatase [Streptacidiphilus fuscans]MBF9072077.1 SpoIIE family protein phosphatase [Streptacidiphilus fuscans]
MTTDGEAALDVALDAAFIRAMFEQGSIGIAVHDRELRLLRTNAVRCLAGPDGALPERLADVLGPEEAEEIESRLRTVVTDGVPVHRAEYRVRPLRSSQPLWLSLSAFPLTDEGGRITGVAVAFTDITAERQARRRLDLLDEASTRIGASLDVGRTAQDLAEVLGGFADVVMVDLADAVFTGADPPQFGVTRPEMSNEWHVRRAAGLCRTGPFPAALVRPGEPLPPVPTAPELERIRQGDVLVYQVDEAELAGIFGDTALLRRIVPEGARSVMVASLYARGLVLGTVQVWRTEDTVPYDDQDAALLAQIVSRAALGVDNARRYTREHSTAVTLQRGLLPTAAVAAIGVETAASYVPSAARPGVGGDWFDVIPLSSLRVALIVGDVVGHGLGASVAMGRLRTAVQTLADLDLDPGELLVHLDDLVQRLAVESGGEYQDLSGATCLYAIYDPVSGLCTMASAGHPPPLLVAPDGGTAFAELDPGPPLGVGAFPFEVAEVQLEPGSTLALYTDGLVQGADHDLDAGMARLLRQAGLLCLAERPLAEAARGLLSAVTTDQPSDDVALLLARTRRVAPGATAHWEFPTDAESVALARRAAVGQLDRWGLSDLAFSTELVVSELVTNALRYAGGPIGLRLVHGDGVLVCEVSDPSNTQPRLRRARDTDEGGRGLFLVAQLTSRWGSRYGQSGKTIWTEQDTGSPDAVQ